MKNTTKYTIQQAAKIIGVERQTMYRHIRSKGITTEKDKDENLVIDASELIRVYGPDINFAATEEGGGANDPDKKLQDVTTGDSDPETDMESKIYVVRLEARVESLESQLETKENENGFIKGLLDEEKTERKKTNNLLEDQRAKASKAEAWERELEAVKKRVANNEKAVKEEAERFQKIREQNIKLKRALNAEKNKTLFQRVFGLKKAAIPRQKAI